MYKVAFSKSCKTWQVVRPGHEGGRPFHDKAKAEAYAAKMNKGK